MLYLWNMLPLLLILFSWLVVNGLQLDAMGRADENLSVEVNGPISHRTNDTSYNNKSLSISLQKGQLKTSIYYHPQHSANLEVPQCFFSCFLVVGEIHFFCIILFIFIVVVTVILMIIYNLILNFLLDRWKICHLMNWSSHLFEDLFRGSDFTIIIVWFFYLCKYGQICIIKP